MIEPLLQCQICGTCYREATAHRAAWGRWTGQLISSVVGCGHPLTCAVYCDPATRAPLRPYGTPDLARWATPPTRATRWHTRQNREAA